MLHPSHRARGLAALGAALALLCGCGSAAVPTPTPPPPPPVAETAEAHRSSREILRELVFHYAREGEAGALLAELRAADADAGARWTEILDIWARCETEPPLCYDALPEDLPDPEGLAIVVLGFQLMPDGSMREELIQRLRVALDCAARYPEALIVCTGGGTAARDPGATEAGRMAQWLQDRGVAPERLVVEDRSLTTAQNAMFSYALLRERYPQVRVLALVSSDYHIATGVLLFEAQSVLAAPPGEARRLPVVADAAWRAPSGRLSAAFQASALLELWDAAPGFPQDGA